MTTLEQPIGILGGTFDPIHYGHILLAQAVIEDLNVAEVRFMPCYQPVHREPVLTSAGDRLAMLKLALADYPKLIADDHEIKRQSPSYTIDTLKALRSELPRTPLCLIMGCDAFIDFRSWKNYQEITGYAHLIVVNRPGVRLPNDEALRQFIQAHHSDTTHEIEESLSGHLLFIEVPPVMISATQIRHQIQQHKSLEGLLPDAVIHYIDQHQLYKTMEVNS